MAVLSGRLLILGLIFVMVLTSAVAVVYTKHLTRRLFIELQDLQARRDELEIEWGRLQLEQSALTTHSRLERLARERLNMQLPAPETTVVVQP